jgi:hypothetical protein
MAEGNPRFCEHQNGTHPVVCGEYALDTPPINKVIGKVRSWVKRRVQGGYVYGFSRFGKTWFVNWWIGDLLRESFPGLTVLTFKYDGHDRFSEILFLMELLGAGKHKYGGAGKKKIMLDRLCRFYATLADRSRGKRIVLVIDEAQEMHEPEFRTLCNVSNEMENLGYKLTVISVGSEELTYQHSAFIQQHKIHLMARFMVRWTRFKGISSAKELEYVLNGYDTAEWPSGSTISYTQYFFPSAVRDGFRLASCSIELWAAFVELGPKKERYKLEVPMEHITDTVEAIFENNRDEDVAEKGLGVDKLVEAIRSSDYIDHMSAISHMLADIKTEKKKTKQ